MLHHYGREALKAKLQFIALFVVSLDLNLLIAGNKSLNDTIYRQAAFTLRQIGHRC
ncbi:hypothetical protein D3C71_2144770 [compost metagenome]